MNESIDNPKPATSQAAPRSFIGGGAMGEIVRAKDWSKTPLGPIESWPASLRTAVSLVLNSNFPIALAWGPRHVQIYNDGYWPICGGKHPVAMGMDFSECWASAFPVIGDAFRSALAGTTAFLEDQRMFLDRLGYLEETFFTFSFSPIRDEEGNVAGLFHPVTETTGKMVGQRRTRVLRDLTAIGLQAQSLDEALQRTAETLSDAGFDVPFALFYRIDEGRRTARLAARIGLAAGEPSSPETVDLTRGDTDGWPLALVAETGESTTVDDVRTRFPGLICEPYPEPIAMARVLPIAPPGHEQALALMVVGVSTRIPMNEAYATFHELLRNTVGNVVASALASDARRRQAEALAEIDRAKTAFFANISHEFRTPLTLMLGPLEEELAEKSEPLAPARHERLATAHRNALRLLKLVNTLLDFSRIEAGRTEVSYEPVDLAAITTELVGMFRSAIENAGLTLTVDCQALPEPVFVDRDMWEKIVLNLMSNAFKHTFAGGIGVTLRWRVDRVELAVQDTGVGIPAADVTRLFERFHRVKGARSRTHEGTGIGLALVQELIQLHGGEIRVESVEGQGSTFITALKTGCGHLREEHVAGAGASHAPSGIAATYVEEARQWPPAGPDTPRVAEDPGIETRTDRARIIWADDNVDMREYVYRLLREHYDVTVVSNGLEALKTAIANPPDLVLTDIMMPGLDGIGVLRELRANERTRHIPVILLSARAGAESAIGGLEVGADDYLTKPFAARELLARVQTHLGLARLRREWALEQRRVDTMRGANEDLERKVAERTMQLQAAKERAESADRLKSEFLANMSHELRTPLNGVLGFTEFLIDEKPGPLNPKQREFLTDIYNSGSHLLALINDILDLAKVEAGQTKLHLSTFSAGTAIQGVCSVIQGISHKKRVTLTATVADGLQGVVLDERLFKQICYNLLSNAVKFTDSGGTVDIIAKPRGEGWFVVRVIDTGIGIQEKDLPRLFTEFTQLDSGSGRRFEGTGLGLALTRRLVELHGGRIDVRSTPGQGSTFQVTLPLRVEERS